MRKNGSIKNHVDDLMPDGNKEMERWYAYDPDNYYMENFIQTKIKSEQNGKLLQLQHGQAYIH